MQRFCSVFSQLLQLFPRLEFQQVVNKHRAERHARGFDCWTQFVAMHFCQLGRAHSLREICGGLASCLGKLRHLDIAQAPGRSTLAYANAHRPAGLYRDLFFCLLDRWHIAQAVRAFTGPDPAQFRRLMQSVWQADSQAALEALRTSPLRRQRPKEFHALFGYLLGNREGLDAWHHIPAPLRRTHGRTPPLVQAGSGAGEKHIEVEINRRCQRQGRSWNPHRAERLLQLKQLWAQPGSWNSWWRAKPQFHLKPNPP